MRVVVNRVFSQYKLKCSFQGCGGQRIVDQALSCGLKKGEKVPEMFGPIEQYGCPRCHRPGMFVEEVPPEPVPEPPKGFVRIPE